MMFN